MNKEYYGWKIIYYVTGQKEHNREIYKIYKI